ncbi:MAG: cysteine--tRNA ligase [Deltaproteobacteria bacterium]|nr:MAG: cysteine--tRNA ligase [Deltaproteobacteria bacterium]
MTLSIFNTLNGRKEVFEPLRPGQVGMYVCGVTVYDMCHIGHARAYVTADVIYRYLQHLGYRVTYVRNFTDVDDKIIKRAAELGTTPEKLAERYIREFSTDMQALGLQRVDVEPRVTQHINEIIELVQLLIERGHAYQVEGDVYFDVPSYPQYGKLSKRNLEQMKAGARVEVDPRKRSPLDFALWKAAKPGEPWWESPWGRGRPGWHIECSAMSAKYLGRPFDLHGGGKDLVFPHHENEIAQSEAAYGGEFVRTFFHNGFVNIDKEKMSKSLGNFFTIRQICQLYDAEALRYFLLTTHYRSPLNFEVEFVCPACQGKLNRQQVEQRACPHCSRQLSEQEAEQAVRFPSLEESRRRLEYLYNTLARMDTHLQQATTGVGELLETERVERLWPQFLEALDDDFNAAAGLAVLADATRLANEVMDNKAGRPEGLVTSTVQELRGVLQRVAAVLGVLERKPAEALQALQAGALHGRSVDRERIEELVAERSQARKTRDFQRADAIRDELKRMGIELMDGPEGTTWRIAG